MKFIKAEQVERGKLVVTKKEFDKEIKEILDEIDKIKTATYNWKFLDRAKQIIKQKSGFKELE